MLKQQYHQPHQQHSQSNRPQEEEGVDSIDQNAGLMNMDLTVTTAKTELQAKLAHNIVK